MRSVSIIVVSYRNSTSNHNISYRFSVGAYVVSYRNSTSNHNQGGAIAFNDRVVSYRNSTSNHNTPLYAYWVQQVVSYRNSTSNHNSIEFFDNTVVLYLIEILHQTTTYGWQKQPISGCILSKFYIKPQLSCGRYYLSRRCILSKFYIKPQQQLWFCRRLSVVSYRNSTSNHNFGPGDL